LVRRLESKHQSAYFPFLASIEDQLSPLLGDDFFVEITALSVSNSNAFKRAHLFGGLESLICESPLSIDLAHLHGLHRLQRLHLKNCQIIGNRLDALPNYSLLQDINLVGTNVSDDDLPRIAQLNHLKGLWLGQTSVTDTGLAYLEGRLQLQGLDLSRTQITDVGIAHLKSLSELKHLSLGNTAITDVALRHLEELPSLTYLELNATQVTPEGIARLKAALPKCSIRYSPGAQTRK
jgi:Leucine-rich repeat (LRR) protein